jgi:iduronate 2-sulfatase
MVRAPWLPASAGRRSATLAELVDVYPTILDMAGASPPPGETLDGESLGWVLRASAEQPAAGKAAVLSVYPRCPLDADGDTWITNTSEMWKNNWCEFVDRSAIPWMGFSMRVADWRYTEWAKWNGTALRPDWDVLAGFELYDHRGDEHGEHCFDAYENVNVAPQNPALAKQLSQQLHDLVDAGQ